MKVTSHNDPWPHSTVEDIFSEETFRIVQEKIKKFPKTPPNRRRISMFIMDMSNPPSFQFDQDGKIDDKWLYDLFCKRFELICPGIDWDKFSLMVEYNSCPAGYKYPIHTDAPEKVVSLVIFISEEGDGTKLYTTEQEFHSQLEWVPNTGLLFERGEDTYHSYESNVNHRDSINCILVPKDKEVMKALRF